MLDLREYRNGLERDVVPPELHTLVGVAQARRRVRLAVAGAVAATAVAAALALGPAGRPDATPPTETPSTVGARDWTASDIVRHPGAEDAFALASDPLYVAGSTRPDDLGALHRWWRCEDRDRCSNPDRVEARTAIEVVDGASDPLVVLMPPTPIWAIGGELPLEQLVRYVGSGSWFLSQTIAPGHAPVLLSAGTASPTNLTVLDELVAPRPGQLAVACGAWFGNAGIRGAMCLLDPEALTLTRVDLPAGVDWSPFTVEGYRGVKGDVVVWQQPDGTFRSDKPGGGEPILGLEMPYDAPRGTLAVYNWRSDTELWLRVSTDGAKTWRVLKDPSGGRSFNPYALPLGWQDWPEVKP